MPAKSDSMAKPGLTIPIFNTYISPAAADEVAKVLQSTFLSEGSIVKAFESRLAAELGLLNPVAVNSGTSALHLALVLVGIAPGDEVICPAQTFIATALTIMQERAVPVFADINYGTGNIDPRSIAEKITPKTRAIMAVHWGGYPCDMDEICAIAKKHGLAVIEDAAHAPGASYKGRAIGAISDFTCFSFQAIKHITTGDGGAVCCRDENNARSAFAKRWFGIDRFNSRPSVLGERQYNVSAVGYKYHLNDYAAALGLANLSGFKERMARRRAIAARYRKQLGGVPGIRLFSETPDRESAYWLFGLHVERRLDFVRALLERGVTASVIHQRIDRNSVFGGLRGDLSDQARFDETQINIPIHDALTEEQAEHIIKSVSAGW
ncbi:MAG TPA: DegT/DnrJ/EryC1/StrS aminotransferase [Elusimicrobia bacterium]|nr:DegT/DnrJ/EryC1/StrS aminotransferase [Elusimicrobiota bacterium]